MADIVHYQNADPTLRTSVNDTPEELTDLTVSWSNLTTAGFANGDTALVVVRYVMTNDTQDETTNTDILKGSTFAGASALTGAASAMSAVRADYGEEAFYIGTVTLATNDNIYLSCATGTITTTTAGVDDFSILILRLDDLAADDYRFAVNTTLDSNVSLGDGDVDGASVTLPSNGLTDDWLILGCIQTDADDFPGANSLVESKLSLAGSPFMAGGQTGARFETKSKGMVGKLDAAADAAVCKVVYSCADATGTTEVTRTAIFALRLEAFVDHITAYDATDTACNTTGFTTTITANLALTTTGNAAVFAQTTMQPSTIYYRHFQQLTADATELLTGWGNHQHSDPWSSATPTTSSIGFDVKSLTNGTIAFDQDIRCVDNAYSADEATLVAFSMALVPTDPANLSVGTASSTLPTEVTIGATTDQATGIAHGIIVANGDESAPTNAEVVDGTAPEQLFIATDKTITASGAFTFDAITGLTPGTTYGYVIVHEITPGNNDAGSRVEGTFTAAAAYPGTAIYDGVDSTLDQSSVLHHDSGTHTGADNASVLTDSTKTWTVDEWIDEGSFEVHNDTDGSSAAITDNDANTVTATLAGGTDNDFDTNDVYRILLSADVNDVIYHQTSVIRSSGSYTFKYYVYDDSGNSYSQVHTVTVTDSGIDGSGLVSLDTQGVPTFTATRKARGQILNFGTLLNR